MNDTNDERNFNDILVDSLEKSKPLIKYKVALISGNEVFIYSAFELFELLEWLHNNSWILVKDFFGDDVWVKSSCIEMIKESD